MRTSSRKAISPTKVFVVFLIAIICSFVTAETASAQPPSGPRGGLDQQIDDNPRAGSAQNPPAGLPVTQPPPSATGNVRFNTANIQRLSSWLAWMALLSCIIGMFISAALWAAGSKGQNPGQELTGKKGMILCCTAAFFVGALPGMLNWLEARARDADVTGVTGSKSDLVANQPRVGQPQANGTGNRQTGGTDPGCRDATGAPLLPTDNCN